MHTIITHQILCFLLVSYFVLSRASSALHAHTRELVKPFVHLSNIFLFWCWKCANKHKPHSLTIDINCMIWCTWNKYLFFFSLVDCVECLKLCPKKPIRSEPTNDCKMPKKVEIYASKHIDVRTCVWSLAFTNLFLSIFSNVSMQKAICVV